MRQLLIIVIMLVLTSACEKTLDKNPVDTLTPGQLFTSEGNLEKYIYRLYETMIPSAPSIYGTVDYWTGDNLSDITTAMGQYPAYIVEGAYSSHDETYWGPWGRLRDINYFLENYQKADVSEDTKNHYAGIARFFRAWFYFDMVKRFGDVPWYGKTLGTEDEDLYKPRDPRTLVMDNVLEDINFAINNIYDIKDNTSSTVTKWVALALKSRICLFEGTFRKYHTEFGLSGTANSWLQQSADAANEIITSGEYSLHENYRALFINERPISQEVILAATYSNSLESWHNANSYYSLLGIHAKYQMSITKRFINTYLNIDGSRFTDLAGHDTVQFQHEVKNRDERLKQTIRNPDYRRSDGSVSPPYFEVTATGYMLLKFSLDDVYYDFQHPGRNWNAIPIMRYAEVLLNLAEAKAEMGTFTETDWDNTIGLLRERAGITNTAMPGTLDPYMQNNFYDDVNSIPIIEIRRERAIELIGEAFRLDDLKRWRKGKLLEIVADGIYVPEKGKLLDLNDDGNPVVAFVDKRPDEPVPNVHYFVIDDVTHKLSEGNKGRVLVNTHIAREFPDYKYYAPIPYTQLVTNTNLVQNEGWDHP